MSAQLTHPVVLAQLTHWRTTRAGTTLLRPALRPATAGEIDIGIKSTCTGGDGEPTELLRTFPTVAGEPVVLGPGGHLGSGPCATPTAVVDNGVTGRIVAPPGHTPITEGVTGGDEPRVSA